jgi:Domain of unknown function (DUF202)
MDRTTLAWTLVAFFGASIAFAALNNATEDSPALVSLAVQVALLAVLIGAVVLIVRRRS